MITRAAKALLVAGIALYYALVVFNNVTDFDSNYQFVRHVLMMDSTFAGNKGMWRAIHAPWVHLAFYGGIILWEALTAALGWWGVGAMVRALKLSEVEFVRAKRVGVAALASGMMLWLV